jgi:hypothetical protein
MQTRALLTLSVLPDRYAICRLDRQSPVPSWAMTGDFFSVTRTRDELSIVCLEDNVPREISSEPGWRLLKMEGPLDFELTGIMASVAEPLAEAGVAIFPIATYETDYVLVKDTQLESAVRALMGYGHVVRT